MLSPEERMQPVVDRQKKTATGRQFPDSASRAETRWPGVSSENKRPKYCCYYYYFFY